MTSTQKEFNDAMREQEHFFRKYVIDGDWSPVDYLVVLATSAGMILGQAPNYEETLATYNKVLLGTVKEVHNARQANDTPG